MKNTLQERLHQTKPFESLETEAVLSLVVLAQDLSDESMPLLKEADLSGPQYNVLRILRGAGKDGLMCSDISKRMVHRVPDVTRLLDRLEARGYVERERDAADRRVVVARITPSGLHAIAPLDNALKDLHHKQLAHLGEKRLRQLISLLDAARNRPAG
ncbi:MAG: MarR family transcriptional regulator [Candidatus Hydrogenedens sp.]|nr:MarR family transcriptional regulator [Candidatus Hydrogenedens sp.]